MNRLLHFKYAVGQMGRGQNPYPSDIVTLWKAYLVAIRFAQRQQAERDAVVS